MSAHPDSQVPSPSKHQLALMIWIAVFPTLTVLNPTLGAAIKDLPIVVRTFILATVAVPIVIYGCRTCTASARESSRLVPVREGSK